MIDLENPEEIKKADPSKVADSIAKLPDQIQQAWKESSHLQFPADYRKVKNVVINGMGGSGLGPELLTYLYKDKLKIPVSIIHDYHLPAYANEDSLVILSSYSGSTEEVVYTADEALAKKCKITAVTEGRKIGEFLKSNHLTGYIFKAQHNPSEQPRTGLGYSIGALLGIFSSLGFIEIDDKEIEESVLFCTRALNERLSISKPTAENFAKEVAGKLKGKIVGVIGAEFLSGNAHIFANQLNETAKTFAFYFLLSELNHHLLEGFGRPVDLGKYTAIIFFDSDHYSEKIKKRSQITKEIIEKQGVEVIYVKLEGSDTLTQAFEAIVVSSWTSFYLGLIYGFDPSQIPWVDYFKVQLAKQ